MAKPHSFSRFAYFDTNILSQLAKDRQLWPGLARYLPENDLTLAVGSQVAELADVARLHDNIAVLLTAVPAAIIKTWDTVLDEEVRAHPQERLETLLAYPLNALLFEADGPSQFRQFLASHGLQDARQGQRDSAPKMFERLTHLKSNFPPAADGKYKKERAPPEQSRVLQMQNRSARGPAAFHRIEHVPDVFGVHDPERCNSGERLSVRTVQFIQSATIANELAFAPLRQVQLPAKRMAVSISASLVAIATAGRTAMPLNRGILTARIVVPRVKAIEHGIAQTGAASAPVPCASMERWRRESNRPSVLVSCRLWLLGVEALHG